MEDAVVAAVTAGDRAGLEELLRAGAEPDRRTDGGQTPLHLAVAGGHAEVAACLLHYGASHGLRNDAGLSPLSLDFTTIEMLHAIRQRVRRFRPRRSSVATASHPDARLLAVLERDGIVRIPALVDREQLEAMRQGFSDFVRLLDRKLAGGEGTFRFYDEEEHWWPNDLAYVTNNALKYSGAIARLCCHPTLLSLAASYLGRAQPQLSRVVGMRYLPHDERDNDMFGWHHDMEEQRLKAFVLLTDLGDDDQYMSYVAGSHALLHPYEMYRRNACSLDYCRSRLPRVEIVRTIGTAGDAFVFDSNGAHRGNRRPTATVRDALFLEFATDRSTVWGTTASREDLSAVAAGGPDPFRWLLETVPRKWEKRVRRTAPSWIENLPHLERWLPPAS